MAGASTSSLSDPAKTGKHAKKRFGFWKRQRKQERTNLVPDAKHTAEKKTTLLNDNRSSTEPLTSTKDEADLEW
jgi:hypothetical protein